MRALNEGPGADSDGMDVEEFFTWAAYFSIEPPMGIRADALTGMVMAQQYNMSRGKGKPVRKPFDFMPQWYKPPKPAQTPEQMKRAMQLQFLAMGGDPQELGLE